MMWRWITLLALSALMMTGCAQTRSYQVAVRNETRDPITVGFAKEEGGPFEANWATPEQVAIESPTYVERNWMSVVVPPGKTGVAGPIQGKFDANARAFLRVYGATGELNDLLAISRGSLRRADVPLAQGKNALVVREEKGKLAVERVSVSREPK
jgi:hypothetical protein